MVTAKKSRVKKVKRPAEVYTVEEIQKLFRAKSNRYPSGLRARAMLALGYCAGLRLGEVLALEPKDVDLKNCSVRILHGKGDKARTVGLEVGAIEIIRRWVE